MIMSEMKEKGTNAVPVEMADTELGGVVGGASSEYIGNDRVMISWNAGDEMNSIWAIVDGYRSLFAQWFIHTDPVKDKIRTVAKEKIGKNLRYCAGQAGSVVVTEAEGILN